MDDFAVETAGGGGTTVKLAKYLPRRARLVDQAAIKAIVQELAGDAPANPVEEIQRGIRSGVRKVNIDTDIRLAMTGAMRQAFASDPSEFDPRKALIAAKKAARELCKARFEAFGCAGHADRILPITLELMAKRYN